MNRKKHLPPVTFVLSLLFTPGLIVLYAALFGLLVIMCWALVKAFETSETVPIYPFVVIAIVGYVLLRAMVASFRRKPMFELALKADKAKLGVMSDVVDRICSGLGSKKPDNVLLGFSSSFYVTNSKVQTIDNKVLKGRTLHVSLPLLMVLYPKHVEGVLAHEFAHFTGGDTVYSIYARPVYESCLEGINRLKAQLVGPYRGLVELVFRIFYIPPLLLLEGYYLLFLVVDRRMSRARELRADAVASSLVGDKAFKESLARTVAFGTAWDTLTGSLVEPSSQETSQEAFSGFVGKLEQASFPTGGKKLLSEIESQPNHQLLSTHPAIAERLKVIDLDELQLDIPRPEDTIFNEYVESTGRVLMEKVDVRIKGVKEIIALQQAGVPQEYWGKSRE
jgi:Zn-dependent protease with chaperone function